MSNFPSTVQPTPTTTNLSDTLNADIRALLDAEVLLVSGGLGEASFN